MGIATARRCREEEDRAALRPRLCLHRLDEGTPDAGTTMCLVHHQRAKLASGRVVLDRRRHVQVCEPDDLPLQLGDDEPVAGGEHALDPRLHGLRHRRIAELAEQVGDRRGVVRPGFADRHGHRTGDREIIAKLNYGPVLGEVLTAIVTPFKDDRSIDYDRFRELAQHLLANGSDGLVVAGTTGESPTLTDDERLELFRVAVDAVEGRGTIVAGTGTYSTAHSVHLTREAHDIGVDGFLVVTPYYNKPPPRGIVEHFKAIAAESDRPIIVYNIPGRVVINIEPETISELAEIPSVSAVKQANDDLEQAQRILAETDLDLYAGDDNLISPFLELGGIGGVCVHTHVVGPQVKEMIQAFRRGDEETAKRIDGELAPAYELLKVQTNPIAIKAALNLLGHEVGGLRLPLVEASEGELARVRDCLERLGLTVGVAV